MSPLSSNLRNMLERAIIKARDIAEKAAEVALTTLAVMNPEPFAILNSEQRQFRNALRAKARQLGNGNTEDGFQPLIEEIAYEQWHNRLFARFLAENDLLIHPEGVSITLEICEELAVEMGEGDAWQLAARYASAMLPGIFRIDDPTMHIQFAPESRHKLEAIIMDLPAHLFTTNDALGWVYQFWQTKKKAEINKSGRKIGANDLSPVTQLFTEHYMVQFLLDNSLGAWWATHHPTSPLIKQFVYLRFLEDNTPVAGTFPGWPAHVAEITVMDPCCGSGHFLVAAFDMLYQMRMEEEGLSNIEAVDAVLRDNLFGLELDYRCTQIAAFAVVLAAWKAGGYRQLPLPNIACTGIAVKGQLESWTRLAGDDSNLRMTLEHHYSLFQNAPHLGSLINPNDTPLQQRMFTTDYATIEPLLAQALTKEVNRRDSVASIFGLAAEDVAKAAKLLAGTYTLVVTNVPYLKRGKQDDELKQFCNNNHAETSADLATAFIERCRIFSTKNGSYACVTPQSWLSQNYYKNMRTHFIREQTWNHLSRLGSNAFETISGEVVNVGLLILTNQIPTNGHVMTGIDISTGKSTAQEKTTLIQTSPIYTVEQAIQLRNPDTIISLYEKKISSLLSHFAQGVHGLGTKDSSRFIRCFWEITQIVPEWEYIQSTTEKQQYWGGMEHVIYWQKGCGILHELGKKGRAVLAGGMAWGKKGVCINQMGELSASLYSTEIFDKNVAVILPKDPINLPAIWAFCQSSEFNKTVRQIDQSLKVTNATLVKVPFDLEYWQQVADNAGPLPEPHSNDPTQWLFEGNLIDSTNPLQVAVARLLNYSWPQQKTDVLSSYPNTDNILCLSSVAGKESAIKQLRALLAIAYGDTWSAELQNRLLQDAGFGGKSLEIWLRDGFFEQHCRLFHNRPFIWHIWDGRKDGFSALVNYHRLDAAELDKLTYLYLGSWINMQRAEKEAGVVGAEARLIAATDLQKKLEEIRIGEPPFDIYVRWKKLHEQPIGWNPDLNDGVRLNIRPFVEAGILRNRFTINWNKDRGTDPNGGERLNDIHTTLAEKSEARAIFAQ